MEKIELLKEKIDKAKKIVVFSGAGISCPPPTSIPDFRSQDGIFNASFDGLSPEEIVSHSYFMKNPEKFFEFYHKKMVYEKAAFNDAHRYFADLEKNHDVSIVTQNIDGLHTLAGSTKVYELHGSVWRNHCMHCHKFYNLSEIDKTHVPYCKCGGIIKPDVVLYEEGLDEKTLYGAIEAISEADLLIVVGTSLRVYPAAGLIRYFKGNNIAVINKDDTKIDGVLNINMDIIDVVRELKK